MSTANDLRKQRPQVTPELLDIIENDLIRMADEKAKCGERRATIILNIKYRCIRREISSELKKRLRPRGFKLSRDSLLSGNPILTIKW